MDKWLNPGCGHGKNKMNLEHTVTEVRKSSKTDGDMPKGYRGQFERDSTGYIKNKLENQFNTLNKKVIHEFILVQIWQTKQIKKKRE